MVLNVIHDFNLDHASHQFDGTTNIKPTYVEEPGEEVVVTMISELIAGNISAFKPGM